MRFDIQRLKRTTSSKTFIPEIDGLRFFAIITVVLYHVNTGYARSLGHDMAWALRNMGDFTHPSSPGWWWRRLDMGVKVFFSISGFVLALPFLKSSLQKGPPVDLKAYFIRRLTRLEPPFLATLTLFLLVHVLLLDREFGELMPSYLAGLLYSHKFVFGTVNPINPVTWSLETEAQFYLIVPLLFSALFAIRNPRLRWSLLLALSLSSIFFRMFAYHNREELEHLDMSILAFFSNFSTGIIFAWIYIEHGEFLKRKSILWDLWGALSIVAMFFVYKPQHQPMNNLAFNIFTLVLFTSAFKGRVHNRFFTLPLIYVTGGMCYTIYLIHFAFIFFTIGFTSHITSGMGYTADLLLQILLTLPLLFIVSSVFFLLLEKPCMEKDWHLRLLEDVKRRLSKSAP